MRDTGVRLAASIAAITLGAMLVLVPASASADEPTAVEFETLGPVSVPFGDTWFLRLNATVRYAGVEVPPQPLGPTDGTVDVFFSGISGAFATALPIQPDGRVYVSQPKDMPLLAAGDYEVRAIFNPASGRYLESGQTATPLNFTVTPLTVAPTVQASVDASISELPIITASLTGSYVDSVGGAPAGTWRFSVSSTGDEPAFETEVAQEQGATEPLQVEVTSELRTGTEYTVTGEFTPVEELAGGLEVSAAPTATFATAGTTVVDALTTRVAIPWWAAAVAGVLVLGLAAILIYLSVLLSRTKAPVPASDKPNANSRIPGDPADVELMTWDEAGIPEESAPPLPESTTWLLSDIEPDVASTVASGDVALSETPTERLPIDTPDDPTADSDISGAAGQPGEGTKPTS